MTIPKVHLFNPDNDSALGHGAPSHTPSREARLLERDLALLPALWAAPGDYILAPYERAKELTALRPDLQIYRKGVEAVPEPWGWSLAASRLFRRAGVPAHLLPPDEAMERHRLLSHRRTALRLVEGLAVRGISSANDPREFFSTPLPVEMEGRILKRPWSCSGRGVFPTATLTREGFQRLAEGIIRKQGSVMAERPLARLRDFSMLWEYDGEARFKGYSLFNTSDEGRYEGNVVARQEDIEIMLGGGLLRQLTEIRSAIAQELPELLGSSYHGWLSVDMITYRDDEGVERVCPCIEVNLRHTMGAVAYGLALSGRTGTLRICRTADIPAGATLLTGGPAYSVVLSDD